MNHRSGVAVLIRFFSCVAILTHDIVCLCMGFLMISGDCKDRVSVWGDDPRMFSTWVIRSP